MSGPDLVTFLTDFGRRDTFVGVCHAVIHGRAPHARIVDLTHDVPPQDVRTAALLLARAVVHTPVAVHLAVVDPGVGTHRRPVALQVERGDRFVGPDNGLLVAAADALGGVVAAHELAAVEHRLPTVSATFHGRDVFAPAAGALAAGTDVAELGPAVGDLVTIALPDHRVEDGALIAEVALVDHFGNVQLAAPAGVLRELDDPPLLALDDVTVPVVTTFGDLDRGALGLYADSDGYLALAVNGGSAARRLALGAGDTVRLTVTG